MEDKYDSYYLIILLLLWFLAFIMVPIKKNMDNKPIVVCSNYGVITTIDNDLMKEACRLNGIGNLDIRWDTLNRAFVFQMPNGKMGYVFNKVVVDSLKKIGFENLLISTVERE